MAPPVLDGRPGVWVMHIDFTAEHEKSGGIPDIQELHNVQDLKSEIDYTYGRPDTTSPFDSADEKHPAPAPRRPHDTLSIYLVRARSSSTHWAMRYLRSTNLTSNVPDFAAALNGTAPVNPAEPILGAKAFRHNFPEDSDPPSPPSTSDSADTSTSEKTLTADDSLSGDGLIPYKPGDSLYGLSMHYPWYRILGGNDDAIEKGKDSAGKFLDLRQSDGSFIEVSKGHFSVLIHRATGYGEEEDRCVGGAVWVFDDYMREVDEDQDGGEDEKDDKGEVLNPFDIKRCYQDWTKNTFILNRPIMTAMIWGSILGWRAKAIEELVTLGERHLSCNKEHILLSTPSPFTAHELFQTESLFLAAHSHLTSLTTSLPRFIPYFPQIQSYSFLCFPAIHLLLNPHPVAIPSLPAPSLPPPHSRPGFPPPQPRPVAPQMVTPKSITLEEAVREVFREVKWEIKEELLPAGERNLNLLHTVAILEDSRESKEQGASMRRLTWITFVFLPCMAVSSVFGMNVNTFNSGGSDGGVNLVWFFVAAVPMVGVVLGAWWGMRRWRGWENWGRRTVPRGKGKPERVLTWNISSREENDARKRKKRASVMC